NITKATASVLGAWNYGYGAGINGHSSLASVTRPDGSQWTYGHSGSLITTKHNDQDDYKPPLQHCQDVGTPWMNTGTFTYTVGAPSGATATYQFTYLRHYRNYVPKSCNYGYPYNDYPADVTYFDNFSITSKTITGVGLPTMAWSYNVGGVSSDESNGSPGYYWSPVPAPPDWNADSYIPPDGCTTCGLTHTTTVTGPSSIIMYSFGMNFGRNEGQLLDTEVDDLSSHVLKTTTSTYVSDDDAPNEPFPDIAGKTLLSINIHPMGNRVRPVEATQIVQDGATFTTDTNSFDAFARATSETGVGSNSKTITTGYADDLSLWVLGLTTSTTVNGTTASSTDYDSLDRPLHSYAFGKLISTKAWHAADHTPQSGTLSSVTDGDNNKTTLSNWYRGIPQSVAYADGTSQSALVNDAGWISSVTDENHYTTSYTYDTMGRVSNIAYPTGDDVVWNPTQVSFAPVNSIEYSIPAGHWKQTIQTGAGKTVTFFDALWRPLVTETLDTNNVLGTLSQTVKRYDAGGRAIFVSYPLSNTALNYATYNTGTHTSYDALDRVTEVDQDSELNPSTLKTITQYLTGFQTKVTDPRGYATTTSYVTYGAPDTSQPAQVTYANGDYATITRDVFGKPIWLKRNGTGYEFFVYDDHQQLCKRSAMGIVDFYAYDGAGNLVWGGSGLNENGNNICDDVTQANAGTHLVTRTYDQRNRLKTLSFHDGNGNQSLTYTPDGLTSQIATTNIANGVSTTTINSYLYDRRRLMSGEGVSVGSQFNWAVGYGYDANGHLSTRYTPSGQTYSYQPDALGRPTQLGIQNVNTYVYNISYYPNGHLAEFDWNNGLTHQATENLRGLPSELEDFNGSNIQMELTYAYDHDGDPTTIGDITRARNATLQYDSLDRLSSALLAYVNLSTPTTYAYDALGQITQTALGTHTQTFTYGTSVGRPDELYSVTDSQTGTTSYTYDAQGNLATRNSAVNYTFDYGNHLRGVGSYEFGYAYDGYGRRVQQTNSSGTINSFYDHTGQLIYQQGRDGSAYDYLYLQGHLVAIRDYNSQGVAVRMRYQDTDAEGSIIRQTDSSGNQYPYGGAGPVYNAWGQQIGGLVQDGPGYTGHVMDQSTSLIYMQQRYYDPTVMHFLSMDPVDASNADGSNLDRYWYANDNPYRYTDPDGRCAPGMCIRSEGGIRTPDPCEFDPCLATAPSAQKQALQHMSYHDASVQNGDETNESKFVMNDSGGITEKTQDGCYFGGDCGFTKTEATRGSLFGHTHVYPPISTGAHQSRILQLTRDEPGPGDAGPLLWNKTSAIFTPGGYKYLIEGTPAAPHLSYLGGGNPKFGMFVEKTWKPNMKTPEIENIIEQQYLNQNQPN
ncbi:MAG: RHS repeat domain-containing protein, partial [Terriglobales bacterium]